MDLLWCEVYFWLGADSHGIAVRWPWTALL